MSVTPEELPEDWDEYLANFKKGDEARWMKQMERDVLANPEPAFTWLQIQRDALTERKARFTEFASQKNYEMVDWFIDNPPEFVEEDMLFKTQALTKNTHEMEIIND